MLNQVMCEKLLNTRPLSPRHDSNFNNGVRSSDEQNTAQNWVVYVKLIDVIELLCVGWQKNTFYVNYL